MITSRKTWPRALCMAATGLTGLLILAVSGCATLSEGECLTADWYEIGQQDGRSGHERSRLHDHRKACAKHAVTPDENAYFAGRDDGLRLYCTPERGFEEGLEGRSYRGVCAPERERGFLAEHRKGLMLYEASEAIAAVENDIARKEALLKDEDTGRKQARELQRDLDELYRQLRTLNRDLIDLERRFLSPARGGW
ncbi:MAG TPA: DUF2799 domain-containing protein [Wenzhouxiangella sp.]|nr:DUF2799 domain-containing protein [Wenzhouxiangella sp.]